MNRLPVKVTYAIMAAIELARREGSAPIQAKIIAKRQRIPARFIEQILQRLKQAGIVQSVRGPQGGYKLAQDPRIISLADLVNSMNGVDTDPLNPNTPLQSQAEGHLVSHTLLSEIWQQVREAEQAVLRVISIEKLAKQYQKLETQHGVMYHI